MIFAKNFARNYEKSNTWNIRGLVDESFFPSYQRITLQIVGFHVTKPSWNRVKGANEEFIFFCLYSQVLNERACLLINFQYFAPSACSYSPMRVYHFFILPLLLVYSIFPKDTWNWYTVNLSLHGKVYISSQTVHSANSEPKLSLIVLLFNTFSHACLLDFQKKIQPARLFHPALLFDT